MPQETLRVGKISFLNLFPIFSAMDDMALTEKFVFVEGYPSELNRMLREGELDLSPSSSIEYLRDKDSYRYLPGHSISSQGAIRSILLFSRLPIEDIAGREVMATHQSETSIALLRIILSRFYKGRDCTLKVTTIPLADAIREHSAYLSIGDEALTALAQARVLDMRPPENCHAICSIDNQVFYVYDIGQLWRLHTGLPAVFALWTYRAGLPAEKLALIEEFRSVLDKATAHALKNLDTIAQKAGIGIPPDEAVAFWRGITYGMTEDCINGLELFEKYLREDGEIA